MLHWAGTSRLLIILGFFLLTGAIYGQSVRTNEFVDWDDTVLVVENPLLQELSINNIAGIVSTYDPELYIPLTFLSYHVDRLVGGGFFAPVTHSINLILHTCSALLAAWVAYVLSRKNAWIGVVCGLLFAVHPLHTEAVAWASARKDLLAAIFFLLSLGWYLKFWERDQGGHRIRATYWTSVLFFFLALLSKVIAVTLPVVLLLIDWREGRPIDRNNIKEKAPYFVLSLLFGAVALAGQSGSGMFLSDKLLLGARSTLFYLQKIVWPSKLAVLYPFTEPLRLSNPEILLSVLLVLAITAAAMLLARRTREPLFAWGFFLVTVAPTFTNFSKGDLLQRDIYIASDRYAYIPSVAIFFLAALLLYQLFRRRRAVAFALVFVVLAILSALSYRQSRTWENTALLFLNVVGHYDNAQFAHNKVGVELLKRGRTALALAEFQKSLALRPNERAYSNVGHVAMQAGDYETARAAFLESLKINPLYVDANAELGALFLILGQPEEAIKLTEIAAEIEPTHFEAHYNTALAYERLGQREKSIAWYRRALLLRPDDRETRAKIEALGE